MVLDAPFVYSVTKCTYEIELLYLPRPFTFENIFFISILRVSSITRYSASSPNASCRNPGKANVFTVIQNAIP